MLNGQVDNRRWLFVVDDEQSASTAATFRKVQPDPTLLKAKTVRIRTIPKILYSTLSSWSSLIISTYYAVCSGKVFILTLTAIRSRVTENSGQHYYFFRYA